MILPRLAGGSAAPHRANFTTRVREAESKGLSSALAVTTPSTVAAAVEEGKASAATYRTAV
jgi:hypothetical protein